jgi:hypothetical protein
LTNAEKFLEEFGNIDDEFIEEAMNYTMKKKFNFKPIIAIAACAALALAAVPVVNHFVNTPGVETPDSGNDTMFTVYESGIHDGEIIGTHKIEMVLNTDRAPFKDKSKVGSEGTVTLNGMEWKAEYDRTYAKTDYTEVMYSYEGISNGRKVIFGINSVTGKCEDFIFETPLNSDISTELTRDELYAIAYEDFMNGGYTDDPENYTLSAECDQGAGGYWFRFSRFVDGIETCEYAIICIRKNGEFYWFRGNRIGEMKNVDVSEIDMDKFYSAVETKLKAIYADAYVDFDKKGAVLTKLTNGSYVFDYKVNTTVKNDKGEVILDRCSLTILMDK